MAMNKSFRWIYLAALLSSATHAALFSDDEARRAIARTDQNIRALDNRLQQIEEVQRNQSDSFSQLEQLRSDIAQVRGQVEVLQNDLNQLKQSQRDFYSDLDRRLKTLENSTSGPSSNASGNNMSVATNTTLTNPSIPSDLNSSSPRTIIEPSHPSADNTAREDTAPPIDIGPSKNVQALMRSWKAAPSNEKLHYDQALQRWKANQYSDAAPLFFHFAKLYPKSPLSSVSLYYAGLSWRMIKNNQSAKEAFQRIAELYPDSPKMPNALFVLGQIAYEQGDTHSARRLWRDVVNQFPKAEVARKAKANLDNYSASGQGPAL